MVSFPLVNAIKTIWTRFGMIVPPLHVNLDDGKPAVPAAQRTAGAFYGDDKEYPGVDVHCSLCQRPVRHLLGGRFLYDNLPKDVEGALQPVLSTASRAIYRLSCGCDVLEDWAAAYSAEMTSRINVPGYEQRAFIVVPERQLLARRQALSKALDEILTVYRGSYGSTRGDSLRRVCEYAFAIVYDQLCRDPVYTGMLRRPAGIRPEVREWCEKQHLKVIELFDLPPDLNAGVNDPDDTLAISALRPPVKPEPPVIIEEKRESFTKQRRRLRQDPLV